MATTGVLIPQQRPHSPFTPHVAGFWTAVLPCEAGHPHPPEMKVSILTGSLPLL